MCKKKFSKFTIRNRKNCIFAKLRKCHSVKEKNYFKQFDIRFGTLPFGHCQMEVNVSRLFFEKYKNDDILDCNICININVERKQTMVSLNFDLKGIIVCLCDRCLEKLTIPIARQETLILKTTGIAQERENEDIVFVGEKEYSYNIEQIVYEYIVGLIPMRKVHQQTGEETCNADMLKLIEEAKNASSPKEDGRWDVLKNIEFK